MAVSLYIKYLVQTQIQAGKAVDYMKRATGTKWNMVYIHVISVIVE